jgi:hypothetical protein
MFQKKRYPSYRTFIFKIGMTLRIAGPREFSLYKAAIPTRAFKDRKERNLYRRAVKPRP